MNLLVVFFSIFSTTACRHLNQSSMTQTHVDILQRYNLLQNILAEFVWTHLNFGWNLGTKFTFMLKYLTHVYNFIFLCALIIHELFFSPFFNTIIHVCIFNPLQQTVAFCLLTFDRVFMFFLSKLTKWTTQVLLMCS